MNDSGSLSILDAAESIARAYGDTETARRLTDLAAEVGMVEGSPTLPMPICPVCGGSVDTPPRVEPREE
jgi:hypothetical protein